MHTVKRCHGAGLAILAALLLPAPAAAASSLSACPPKALSQPFLPWADPARYASVPDGGLEAGGAGWALSGGAAVVSGNEPYHVRGASDRWSLTLPPGSSAATPSMCVDVLHPTLRFFARNTGDRGSVLRVSVRFFDLTGTDRLLTIGALTADQQWGPTPIIPVVSNVFALLGAHPVWYVFTPEDDRGKWRIDDVYVDPYGKG